MSNRIIGSFDDLHAMVQGYGAGHYIFRGESSASYKLRPKFGRSAASTRRDCGEIERGVLNAFMRRSAPYLTLTPSNTWEWLAIAQHYGLATRMLDWTENPLVAAYFALGSFPRSDCVIYALGPVHSSRFVFTFWNLDVSDGSTNVERWAMVAN